LPVPKVTEPSLPGNGVSHAPPEPHRVCAPSLAGTTVLNFHTSLPVAAFSASKIPPVGPVPMELAR
jgi:hypothetical protein